MCEWCSGVLWGAALQRKLTCSLRRPPVPHPPTPVPDLPPKSCSYRQHSQQRPLGQVGITSPPVADGGAALTCVCSVANFCDHQFSGARYDRAAPTGSQTGRRGRIFFGVGMGGMGEGGRVRKMGRGGHGSG